MGISCRRFLFDQNDNLYCLANTKFAQMLEDPVRHRFPAFSGQRARAAEVLVEFIGREPIRVIRITFDILIFDDEGYLDPRIFDEQQRARAELAIESTISVPERKSNIVAAASKFIAQGSYWAPSEALAKIINEAALGKIRCPRA